MSEGRIPEACQKFEESQRLDPGGGTILNLALCREREGRLASAWSEFSEAMAVARRDGRLDREVEASTHVLALGPRLSRLTVVVPPGSRVEGLRIERNGHEVGEAAWSTPMPVDGGEHAVRATAPGREPFTTKLAIAPESDAQTIEIPALALAPVVVATPPTVAAPAPPAPMITPAIAARMRKGGIASAGVGAALLGVAGWALASALNLKKEANADCDPDNVCGDVARQQRHVAVTRGELATVLGASGAVLVGAGALLYVVGRPANASHREARIDARLVLGAGPGTAMAGIEGRF
jgi:hypothetical protein